MSDFKIAAIIITYNRKEVLSNCVSSVLNGSIVPSIVIVDNCSTDGTEEFIKRKFNTIYYIKLESNLGPAGGAEKGQIYAYNNNFDAVWMLDDDSEVNSNALENMLKVYEMIKCTEEKIFMTSVTYGDRDFLKPIYNILLYNNKTGLTSRIAEKNYDREYFKYNISPMLGLFIPRNVFETTGFFKGEYFGWYDDTEFVLRAQKHGFVGFAVPQSRIYHPITFRKRTKIFGKNFTFLSGRPERMYYGTRNNIIAQREFLKKFNFYFIFLPIFITRRFLSIAFFYENKGIFLKEFAKGIRDALTKNC